LFFTISAIGQKNSTVSDILLNGRRVPQTKINIKKPADSKSESKTIQINDPIDSEATIHVLDNNITVVLKSFNGTLVKIPGNNIISYSIKSDHERYELIKSESNEKVVINKLKEYLGSVTATGLTERLQALTRGTIFTLSLTDDELEIALEVGKLYLNHLIKREIKDDIVISNDSIRSIFIRQNSQLTVKEGIYPSPDNDLDSLPVLTDDNEIKKFLQKPFLNQKRDFLNMGEFSKRALKELENEVSIDKALLSLEKALENGELTIDFIIQSALLFADFYLYNDNNKKSRTWLEVGIHYNKILFDTKKENLENSLNTDGSETSEIDKAIIKGLRYEMLTAIEFSAWGYDIKLKLNGCLENPNENPTKYRLNAIDLIKAIDNGN
jgi:hypothetical protein